MMIIALNYRDNKGGGEIKGENEELEERRREMLTTRGMVQPSQKHIGPYVKGVE